MTSSTTGAATGSATGPAVPDQRGGAAALDRLWQRHRQANLDRVVVLERAAVTALLDRLDGAALEEAITAAHSLAGSLGTFGFEAAGQAAFQAEALLRESSGGEVNGKLFAEAVQELRTALAEQDGRAAVSPADAETPSAATNSTDPATPAAIDSPGTAQVMGPTLLLLSRDAELGGQLGVAATVAGAGVEQCQTPLEMSELLAGGLDAAAILLDADSTDPEVALDVLDYTAGFAVRLPECFVLSDGDVLAARVTLCRRGVAGVLPRRQTAHSTIATLLTTLDRHAPRRTTVLSIGANPGEQLRLEELFDDYGFLALAATSADGAWIALERVRPDLVLLDPDLPDVHGLELVQAMRTDPRYQRLPVVVLGPPTSPDETPDGARPADPADHQGPRDPAYQTVIDALAAGADDVVRRPIADAELVARCRVVAQRAREMRAAADVDETTGVTNQRAGERDLDRLVTLASRHELPLTLALVLPDDLDQLRRRSGGAAADIALLRFAQQLRAMVRRSDVVARWRGDVFVVGLYGCDAGNALTKFTALAEQLRSTEQVTFSAGLATLPGDGEVVDALMRAARTALQEAQRLGDRILLGGPTAQESSVIDVVVVDDDRTVADVLTGALEVQGRSHRWLSDGIQAAAQLGSGALRAKLVILDIGLPGLDGFGVLQSLRDRRVLERTKVLVLTVRCSESETLRALSLGASDHVAKPFSLPVLLRRINGLLDG